MKEKNQVVPDEVLSKEFLSWFKTEADVNKFQAGECSAFLPCDAVLSRVSCSTSSPPDEALYGRLMQHFVTTGAKYFCRLMDFYRIILSLQA